jgi:hypothetical protein
MSGSQTPHFGSDPRVDALAPGIDDPNNASGLGAPAIIRGTVYGHLAAGVTRGAGQTTAVQTATLSGLQAALNEAATLSKFFELEPGTYEIYGANGLVIPSSGQINWHGDKGSLLSQFYVNAPILVFGDTTGSTTLYDSKIDGFGVQYGVSQTGNTNANAILMCNMAWTTVENFAVTPNGGFPIVNPSYVALNVNSAGTWFNNCLRNGHLYGGQLNLFSLQIQGSGNLFQDIYMSNGTNNASNLDAYAALSGPAFNIANTAYATMSGNVFERINVESVKGQFLLYLQEAQSLTLMGLHVENCQLNAAGGCVIANVGSNINIIDMDLYDLQTASGLGTCNVIYNSGSGESCTINGLRIGWDTYSDPGLLSPLTVFANGGNNDQNVNIEMFGLVVGDDVFVNLAQTTLWNGLYPLANNSEQYDVQVGSLTSDQVQVSTGLYQPSISSTYTHYGCHEDATLMVPSTLSAATTITLSNKRKASGLGSSLATETGNTVRVRRLTGTYADALTVKDGQSGTTLTTNTTDAVDYLYTFNGTNWVTAS